MKKQLLGILILAAIFGSASFGQSSDENNPTPVTSSVLTGTVTGKENIK